MSTPTDLSPRRLAEPLPDLAERHPVEAAMHGTRTREVDPAVREFARTVVRHDRTASDRSAGYRPGLITEMADLGLFRLRLPVDQGGRGLSAVALGQVLEELASVDLSVCFPVLNASLIGGVLVHNGRPDQLERWLPVLDGGVSVLALTEPGHGTDAAGITMGAERSPHGWRLTGTKASIMGTHYATSGLVFARTGPPGARGVSAFFTPLADGPTLRRERLRDLGCRAGGRGNLHFSGFDVSDDDMVGAPGSGFVEVMRGFGISRPLIALMALAVAQSALTAAFDHVTARDSFGAPLSSHQSVIFPLVEHATTIRAARSLAYEALEAADRGEDPRVPANMVKWWAPKAAVEATHQALLAMGHYGWDEDGPVAKRLRDVIGMQLADGTAAATKMVVARALVGRESAP
ncbi:acyl-CoA dehydrogenase family protein [Myceligenerans cantabricum]